MWKNINFGFEVKNVVFKKDGWVTFMTPQGLEATLTKELFLKTYELCDE